MEHRGVHLLEDATWLKLLASLLSAAGPVVAFVVVTAVAVKSAPDVGVPYALRTVVPPMVGMLVDVKKYELMQPSMQSGYACALPCGHLAMQLVALLTRAELDAAGTPTQEAWQSRSLAAQEFTQLATAGSAVVVGSAMTEVIHWALRSGARKIEMVFILND